MGVAFSGDRIETESGKFINLFAPSPDEIDHTDIAAGLSRTCRFAGQCSRFYSVAEHSVLVADLAVWLVVRSKHWLLDIARYGLLHDAPEAYLGDLTAPLKNIMRYGQSAYDVVYDDMEQAIYQHYGLQPPDTVMDSYIKMADQWAFCIEARYLLPSKGERGYDVPPEIAELGGKPDDLEWAGGLLPGNAKQLWLKRWLDK